MVKSLNAVMLSALLPRIVRPALRPRLPRPLLLACLLVTAAQVASAQAAAACSARSARLSAPVVELYTSEGCSSCPPADRWLSKLKLDPTVVALAYHVDYWDRLGWKDRFASAAFSQRQTAQQASNGARFSYTPQVVVDGRDRTDWSAALLAGPGRAPARVEVTLALDGERALAEVVPMADAPKRLAAYWAVTEDGHVSTVKAGENGGTTLHHDFVVRELQPVAAWAAQSGRAENLRFQPAKASDPAHPRSLNLVIVDAATGRPVQALKVGC